MTRRPMHTGEILGGELEEAGVKPAELARQLGVPANRVTRILHGQRSVTGDTALRLGHWFGMNPQFWLNLQSQYDLALAEEQAGDEISKLQKLKSA